MLKPLIIGIAGGSGSGKSTVARNVADHLTTSSVAFIDMDAYYKNFTSLTLDERRKLNWDHPDAFDYDLLCAHLEALGNRKTIDKPEYDFVSHLRRTEHTRVEPADVIVIDGILLFVDARVRDLCDVKVFVDADADIRLIRRIERDIHDRGRPLDENHRAVPVHRSADALRIRGAQQTLRRCHSAARRTQRDRHRDDRR